MGQGDGPVFPDAKGGYRDRNNVGAAFRLARTGTDFEWVKPHTYRKTVTTLLDGKGATARMIADQLGHSRISMTQDVYMGRRAVAPEVAEALATLNLNQGGRLGRLGREIRRECPNVCPLPTWEPPKSGL